MPAILEDADWSAWLGVNDESPEQAKAALKTKEHVNWKMAPEKKAENPKPAKPPKPDKPPREPNLL